LNELVESLVLPGLIDEVVDVLLLSIVGEIDGFVLLDLVEKELT
jgi:hypothetical protein